MSKDTRECRCKVEHILLYGITSYDYVTQRFSLHAVDRTKARALAHQMMIKDEFRLKEHRAQVRIEEFESDHAFASSMIMA